MSLLKSNPTKFYQTESNTGSKNLDSSQAILDVLNEPDDDTTKEDDEIDLSKKSKPKKEDETKDTKGEVDKEVVEEDKEDKEEDELTDIELELTEDDDEDTNDDDDLEIVNMPRRKEILEKYPDLFRIFPGLEKAFFRDRKFSELFPTPNDAKLASDKATALDNFERELLSGNTTNVLKAVKEEDQNSFNKLVDNYLPSLRQIDEKAYFHVLGTVIKGTIYNMIQESRESDNQELQEAARVLNKFVFQSEKYVPPKKLADESADKPNPEADKLNAERRQFEQQRFDTAFKGIQTRVGNLFEKVINKEIDPNGSMTDWVKGKASKDAQDQLDRLLDKDTRFKQILNKAWEKARESNYDDDSIDRLMKVIKNRAGALLPSVIKKARNEALKGMGKRVKAEESNEKEDESGDTTSSSNRGPLKSKEKNNNNNKSQQNGIPKGMSARDYIMSD